MRYVRDAPLTRFSRVLADNPGGSRLEEIAMSMNFAHDSESVPSWSLHQQTASDCQCPMKNVRFSDRLAWISLPLNNLASSTAQLVHEQGRSSSIGYLPFFWSRSMLDRGCMICIPTSQSTLHAHLIPTKNIHPRF